MSLRKDRLLAVVAGACCLGWALARVSGVGGEAAVGVVKAGAVAGFESDVRPLVGKYCLDCHNADDKLGGLSLDGFKTTDDVMGKRKVWETVAGFVKSHQMPPEEAEKQPTDAERKVISGWVEGQMLSYYTAHPDPGKVVLRRMNRAEYGNTIRDLTGVDFDAAEDFPQDDSGYGFDNIGDVLTLPPVLMEKYLAAAERVIDAAWPTEPPVSRARRVAASQAEVGFNALGDRGDGWVHLLSLEEDTVSVEYPLAAGDYLVRVKAFCQPKGGMLVGQGSSAPVELKGEVPPTMLGVFVGDTFVQDLEIDAREDAPKVYEARIGVAAGKQRISFSVRRNRGGLENETYMLNGRIGKQQPGIVFVKTIEVEGPLPVRSVRVGARKLEATGPGHLQEDGGGAARVLEANGEVSAEVEMKEGGECLLRVKACAQQAGNEPAKMELRVNGENVKSVDVVAPAALVPLPRQGLFDINLLNARPYVYEAKVMLPAGKSRVGAAFVNDYEDLKAENPNLRDRNLIVYHLEVVNPKEPVAVAPMAEGMARYMKTRLPAGTAEAAREMVAAFARRAYRRPVAADELDRLMKLYALARSDGDRHEVAVKLAFKAALVSPHFLFVGHAGSGPAGIHAISETALASRLSYFLWSTMPDEELLRLAERGELRKGLEGQVERMLKSPKSRALVENFAGQWLELRKLATVAPDRQLFKAFDEGVKKSMWRETELLFETVMREDKNVLELLTADYTFLNTRLAKFYEMNVPGLAGEAFVKVPLAGTPRRGLLTQGSILTLTSNPTRTSPVKRGKFVLEQLMGTPPPPAPPDVPNLEETKLVDGTLRQQMEAHRANPQCAGCHAQMDPIGFGLENFDAVGRWRDKDGRQPVDAAGKLRTGETFKTAGELAEILAQARREEFVRNMAEKLLTYALGRGVEAFDKPAVEGIIRGVEKDGGRFSAMVKGVVMSMPFQMEKGDGE